MKVKNGDRVVCYQRKLRNNLPYEEVRIPGIVVKKLRSPEMKLHYKVFAKLKGQRPGIITIAEGMLKHHNGNGFQDEFDELAASWTPRQSRNKKVKKNSSSSSGKNSAPKAPRKNLKRTLATCEVCGKNFKGHLVKKHIALEHPKPSVRLLGRSPKRPHFIWCPKCEVNIVDEDFVEHERSVHKLKTKNSGVKTHKTPTERSSRDNQEKNGSVSREAFNQSYYDCRDARRGHGYLYRDNGQFGSYSVHDDYSDESFPD